MSNMSPQPLEELKDKSALWMAQEASLTADVAKRSAKRALRFAIFAFVVGLIALAASLAALHGTSL